MRFALVGGARMEATSNARGRCIGCGAEMIARCGRVRVHHWAHRGKRSCDQWWENETKWHRQWKSAFPFEWQEVIIRSPDAYHIADIQTPNGEIIEFQHSHIGWEELSVREEFYGPRMVWVVDGTRLKRDRETFMQHIAGMQSFKNRNGTIDFNPHATRIGKHWNVSNRLVYLDFGDEHLWRISIGMKGNWQKHIKRFKKQDFIDRILAQSGLSPDHDLSFF